MPTLGFLNPLIYLGGYAGFTDITSGQSDGCNGNDTQTGEPVVGVSISCYTCLLDLKLTVVDRPVLSLERTGMLLLDGIQSLASAYQTLECFCNWPSSQTMLGIEVLQNMNDIDSSRKKNDAIDDTSNIGQK